MSEPATPPPLASHRLWPVWLCIALLSLIVGVDAYVRFAQPTSLPPVPQPNAEVQALRREIEKQQHALDALDQHRKSPAQNQQAAIDALSQQVQALEEALNAAQMQQSDAVQLLLAFNQVSRAMKAGNAFAAEWEAFEQAAASFTDVAPAIETLAPYAEEGIVTAGWLKDAFRQALREPSLPKDAPLLKQVTHNLSSLVVVRKVGKEHAGNDEESRIARAEYALTQGNVTEALHEIEQLPEARQKSFEEWADEAAWRIDGLKALETLRLAVEYAAQGNAP